jgi:hypothetical protein
MAFEPGLSYRFSSFPPETIPVVRTHAIAEPLKVRMITKGNPETWILKPVQKAMFESMKKFDCFRLTSGQTIDLSILNLRKAFLLSGDYEASTDNLHLDIMSNAVEILCEYITDPVIQRYLKWEGGAHLLTYPKESGLQDCFQTNGQLMGSLLSFPILCIANATTIGLAQRCESLHDVKALINGDDILFCENSRTIKSWKKISASMGLKPSIGKNYTSASFGSINSQLILRKGHNWEVQKTGKFKCLSRKNGQNITARKSLEIYPINLVVEMCRELLEQTPQSLDIPTEFGGIGISFNREPNLQDKEIYFWKLMSKHCQIITQLDDRVLCRIPKSLVKKYGNIIKMSQINEPYDEHVFDLPGNEEEIIFEWNSFRRFQKFYKQNRNLRERIRNSNLKNEIPLNLVKSETIWIPVQYRQVFQNLFDKI